MENYFYLVLGITIGALMMFLLFHKRILASKSEKVQETLNSDEDDKGFFRDITHAIEMERDRIASDIHDELGAPLSGLLLDLQVVSLESSQLSIAAENTLLTMRQNLNGSIESLRRVIYGLLPDSLERGDLNSAVNELCNKKDGNKGTRVLFKKIGTPVILTTEQKLYIYRIIQELINNSLKHSLAWTIDVFMEWQSDQLFVRVTDDGKGFLIQKERQSGKYGMPGIFSRALTIGATAKFIKPMKGMEFHLTLPLSSDLV